ncbi:MAG: hypothetical protein ACOYNC_01235 [Bacteroidales bacterium]
MKKAITVTFAVLAIIFVSSMILNRSIAQSSQKERSIGKPARSEVMKIPEKSSIREKKK